MNAAQVGGHQDSPRSLLQCRQGGTRGWRIVYAACRDGVVFLFLASLFSKVKIFLGSKLAKCRSTTPGPKGSSSLSKRSVPMYSPKSEQKVAKKTLS
jgi:hypothetical protein